jgi:hypothetical protein
MKAMKNVGRLAFVIGIIGAVVAGSLAGLGLFQTTGWFLTTLIVAGVIIGLLNITEQESVPLMVAALVIGAGAGVLGGLPMVGKFVGSLMTAIAAVVLPASIIIAIKTVYRKAS